MCDGVGIDIVPVARLAALVESRGEAFLERWFTDGEIDYCWRKAAPSRHFAARFAAKEAVIKALAATWEGPLGWRYVEIVTASNGVPSVRLTGPVLQVARRQGAADIQVSLSHCQNYATAVAFCTGRAEGRRDG
jgi:holo-[acyl-carrier protein] synthase